MGSDWVRLDPPWLIADLGRMRRVLSFAPLRPGLVDARRIAIRQVRDADLTPDMDAEDWLTRDAAAAGLGDAVAMLTSRGLPHHRVAQVGPVRCVATVGLGNAERVGHRRQAMVQGYGTVNLILCVDAGLAKAAMIEALTIAAAARTAAIMDAGLRLPAGPATGTGTDCIALACDAGDARYAGMHTDLGEALGRAAYDVVLAGAQDWIAVHGAVPPDRLF